MMMRSHIVPIWFEGPEGSGKTTLIQRMLESNRSKRLSVARLRVQSGLEEPTLNAEDNEETRRCLDSGAEDALLIFYPEGHRYDASVRCWEERFYYAAPDGILFEGGYSRGLRSELRVFVARPWMVAEPFVARRRVEVARLALQDYLNIALGHVPGRKEEPGPPDHPDEEAEVIGEEEWEVPDETAAKLSQWADKGVPIHNERWSVPDGYDDLFLCDAAVINVHGARELEAAERMAADIRRVRKDKALMREVLETHSPVSRPSLFIADLSDPKHRGTKQAVARIKRAFRQRW